MRLLKLSCDRSTFRTLEFEREGLSIVVGDAGEKEGSANGTGKTLALNLVHNCLGSRKNAVLGTSVPDWRFRLEFELFGNSHAIERNGDGTNIALDGDAVSLRTLQEWLNNCGVFELPAKVPGFSFRALYRRFARARREDRVDAVKLSEEKGQLSLALSLYLLGADITLALRKSELREQQVEIDDLIKLLRSRDARLRELISSNVRPEARLRSLGSEITGIRERLEAMKIAEDYEAIRTVADSLTARMRELEQGIAIVDYRLAGIASLLDQRPDIDNAALLAFYNGLQDVFRPEALKHFDDVASFHSSLAEQRRARLERDRLELSAERDRLTVELNQAALKRDRQLGLLADRHALSEYQSVVSRLASIEEDHRRLSEFLSAEADLERKKLVIKQEMATENQRAAEYLATSPLAKADERYRALIQLMYPSEAAGITLANNTRENLLRYDLSVDVQGKESDGINAARVVCFDWLLFMHGARHSIEHLWHDNGFFDHIDAPQRAIWLDLAFSGAVNTKKQYIVSINTEDFESTLRFIPEQHRNAIENAVIMRLQGSSPRQKLLGVQIGSASR